MRITVDTQKDTHDDLKKVIQLLSQIVQRTQDPQSNRNMFDDQPSDSSNVTGVFGGLFDNLDNTKPTEPEDKPKPKLEVY
ncbi:hypothetical protein HYV79_01590 [Candidatus Woesearchaeota archaeon]|nr:hypothetical protein [Candidatus Woesearchaeota archaeon]